MADPTASDQMRRQVTANFDAIAPTYDAMHFVQVCAQRLLALAPLAAGARVLDVATGTGVVALGAAQFVGPTGSVTGVDIAPAMLEQARQKLAAAGLANVSFEQGDAERLRFPDASFDVVLCASSLFFVPDMLGALREWRRVLAPGGYASFSSFGPTFLQPLRALWADRLQRHGLTAPWPPAARLADLATCRALLEQAGFAELDVRGEQLGYHLLGAEARWQELMASLEAKPFLQLDGAQRDQIKAEHLAELESLATPAGIWVDVPANIAGGWKR